MEAASGRTMITPNDPAPAGVGFGGGVGDWHDPCELGDGRNGLGVRVLLA